MGWCADNHIPAISKYVRKTYGKKVFSNHLIQRAFQRFNADERSAIFSEVRELLKSGMYQYLFSSTEDTVSVLTKGDLELVLTRNGARLCVKTVFRPNPNRLAKLKAQ